jgi:hypothetical protein
MKRKMLMMGFAMVAGLPHAVCAKGGGKENLAQSYSSWNGAYMPHYGAQGAALPLMDHLSVSPASDQGATQNKWRLDFGVPRADMLGAPDPLMGRDARVGVNLKLDF